MPRHPFCLLSVLLSITGCVAGTPSEDEAEIKATVVTEPARSVALSTHNAPSRQREDEFQRLFEDLPEIPDDGSHELHAVVVGNGTTVTDEPGEHASVWVRRPGKSVVLCLAGESPKGFIWTVKTFNETRIAAVILAGSGRRSVKGLDGVPVIDVSHKELGIGVWGDGQSNRRNSRRLIARLTAGTGMTLSSLNGANQTRGQIPVYSKSKDARLDADYPRVDAEGIQDVEFQAVHYAHARYPRDLSCMLGTFSLRRGPLLETHLPAPQGCAAYAHDAEADQWYGLHDRLYRIDPSVRSFQPVAARNNEFRHPRGLTIDTSRGRLIASADGQLSSTWLHDPEISRLADLNQWNPAGLCYHAADDSLYGLHPRNDGRTGLETLWLARFSLQGALISTRQIDGEFYNGMERGTRPGTPGNVQLISIGDHLAMVLNVNGFVTPAGPHWQHLTYIYRIDPVKALARLTWKNPPSRTPESAVTPANDQFDRPTGLPSENIVPIDELPSLKFEAPYRALSSRGEFNGTSWATYTLAGPQIESMRPVPSGSAHMVQDSKTGCYYKVDWRGIYRLESGTSQSAPFELPDLPSSRPRALAFDVTRRRLLVATSSQICACEVDEEDRWSVLTETHDLAALAFDNQTGRLFSIPRTADRDRKIALEVRDQDAVTVETLTLSGDVPHVLRLSDRHGANTILRYMDGHLVLLCFDYRETAEGWNGGHPVSRMYLINSETGHCQFTWRETIDGS